MGRRGAGRRLNDQERMEILDQMAREPKVKNVDLAKQYGVSEGAIRKLKQIKDTIRDRYVLGNEHNRDKRKRGGFRRNAQFEQELYEWICRMRETQAYQLIPLTQTAVRQQAILLAKNYETMATFKASPGWFARFCSRHRLDPPMAPMRDLDAITAEAEAAAASANATLLASTAMAGAIGVDGKLAGAEGDAALVLGFPQGVDAMHALVGADDDHHHHHHHAVAIASAAAAAAVDAAVGVVGDVPVAVEMQHVEHVEPVEEKISVDPSNGSVDVDLNCPEAIVEEQAAVKADPTVAVPETTTTPPQAEAPPAPASPVKADDAGAKRSAPSSETKQPAKAQVYTEDEIFSLGL